MKQNESKPATDQVTEKATNPKIKTRAELKKMSPEVYNWLIKNKPELLNKHLPL